MNSSNSSSKGISISQIATRKLLRAIKIRAWHARWRKHGNKKRRLSFNKNNGSSSPKHLKTKNAPSSAGQVIVSVDSDCEIHFEEHGTVYSKKETPRRQSNSLVDNDCIFVEPTIEKISILDDDDVPCASGQKSLQNDTNSKHQPTLTSTPWSRKRLGTSKPLSNITIKDVGRLDGLFASAKSSNVPRTSTPLSNNIFRDVGRLDAWFASAKSYNVLSNYTKLSTLQAAADSSRKQSNSVILCESIRSDDTFGNYSQLSTAEAADSRNRNKNCMVSHESITSDDTFGNYSQLSTLKANGPKDNNETVSNNEDVILLDDTSLDESIKSTNSPESDTLIDDSVIFVCETNTKKLPEFIPLESANVPNPLPVTNTPRRNKRKPDELFTRSEKKQLDAFNTNAYNPGGNSQQVGKKRMIVLDGSNVAFHHGLNQQFSIKGIKIVIDYFEKSGHEVKAVVPQYRFKSDKSTDPALLNQLAKEGKVIVTPCKSLPGKYAVSYDDRFILQMAYELDAAIVSNDNYRDLINENVAFKKLIENRVIGYTWCNDLFILPKDPYGKWGPSLESILNRA